MTRSVAAAGRRLLAIALTASPIGRLAAPIAIAGACAAATVAIGATCAWAAYATGPSPAPEGAPLAGSLGSAAARRGHVSPLLAAEAAVLINEGVAPTRAMQAIEVQGAIANADLSSRLEAAMGGAYAGTWFDAAAAQLHVGVASRASRRTAARVVARAGLAADVTLTPVRSTIAQLLAAQDRWSRWLASLFAREQVVTALEPQHNAVAVTLSSAVPARERAALEREAARAHVRLLLSVAPGQQIGFAAEAKECNNFTANNANCNPSITAGVRIFKRNKCVKVAKQAGSNFFKTEKECDEEKATGKEGEWEREEPEELKEEKGEGEGDQGCTAGPAAIPTANRKERVLLTAGHCIQGAGGEKVEWQAFNRALEEPLIGVAGLFVNGGASGSKKGDFGEISIEPGPEGGWQTGNAIVPVLPVTAEWKKEEETRYLVKGERKPEVGNMNCHEGRTSGEWCGKIKALNVRASYGTSTTPVNFKEGLVEDEKALSEGGDSGGPWVFVEANNEVRMEGTHAGKRPVSCTLLSIESEGPEIFPSEFQCLNFKEFKEGTLGLWERKFYTWFQPLKKVTGSTTPGSLEALNLELLTTANEGVPAAFELTTEKCEGGALIVFCWENGGSGLSELKGEEQFEILSPSSMTLKGKVGEETLSIACTATDPTHGAGVANGVILQATPLSENYLIDTSLLFLECKLEGTLAKKCKVPAERSTLELDGAPTSAEDVVFSPVSGTTFVEITIENNGTETCPATIKGTKSVTGTQLCEWASPGTDLAEHLLECDPKSGLKFAETAAELKLDSTVLPVTLGTNWDVVEVG